MFFVEKDNEYVWYACYGSNLSEERFTYYIKGGFFEKNGKEYKGCRDKSYWVRTETTFFPGSIYFGNSSSTWYGGGVAFYDPEGAGKVFMRLYKVTWGQYLDIREQEGNSPEWYGRTVDLGEFEDGCRVYTFTSEKRRPEKRPHDSYYDLIRKAIAEENGMGYEWTDEYLRKALGIKKMNDLTILKKLSVINRDDGECFTIKHRLNRIEKLLSESRYEFIDEGDLFRIYSKNPLDEMGDGAVVVTSHVDVHKGISMCYSKVEGNLLHGTYDNSITNAAVVKLMMDDRLPDNVIIAFTGDEEVEEGGVITLMEHLNRMGMEYRAVVLDVTDEGIEDTVFSIENNFWGKEFMTRAILSAEQTGYRYMFVPFYEEKLPAYAKNAIVSENRSEEDESWTFDQYGIECFSLCVPTYGEMHDDSGLYVEKWVYEAYIKVLDSILSHISGEAAYDI